MKSEKTLVQFDRPIKGPGDPQSCQNTETYAIGGRYADLLIEFDDVARVLTLFDAKAKVRPVVEVVAERIVRMEPVPAKSAKKVA